MPGNRNSGPRRFEIPGLMPGGCDEKGRPLDPLKGALRYEDLEPPDVLNIEGVKFWRVAAKKLCTAGELDESHLFGLRSLAYQHQWLVRKERAGVHITAQERASYNRMLKEFGLSGIRGRR